MTFEQIKKRYNRHYITNEQLRRFVELGIINSEQYKEICGEDYS